MARGANAAGGGGGVRALAEWVTEVTGRVDEVVETEGGLGNRGTGQSHRSGIAVPVHLRCTQGNPMDPRGMHYNAHRGSTTRSDCLCRPPPRSPRGMVPAAMEVETRVAVAAASLVVAATEAVEVWDWVVQAKAMEVVVVIGDSPVVSVEECSAVAGMDAVVVTGMEEEVMAAAVTGMAK